MSEALDILLVEDLPADAELTEHEIARALGECRCRRAETREAFLRALDERVPDVIVSDFSLPDFDGLSALTLAKARFPDVPFILLTGSINEDTAVDCMKAGAWDYVLKGHTKRLGAAILGAVEQRRLAVERREAARALLESGAQLREAQRLGRIGNWRYLLDKGELVWSEMVYVIYGRDPSLGPPTLAEEDAYYSPEDARLLRHCAETGLSTGRRYEVDVSVRVSPTRQVDVVLIGAPLRDPSGRIIGLEGTVQDITERKRAVRELEFRNLLLVTQQEASLDGILVVDGSRLALSCNGRFVELFGLSRDAVEASAPRPLLEGLAGRLVNPPRLLDQLAHLDAHPLERSHLELELTDGRTLDSHSAPLTAPNGTNHGRVWFFRDITQRKRADADRERLAMAIEQAAEMVVVTDAKGEIQYVNPAFEATTGYTRQDVLGKNPRLLNSHTQDAAVHRSLWETIARGRSWTGRFVNRRKDGTLFTEETTISPVRDASGLVTSYVGVARDITGELNLEAQFLQAQRMESVGRLAGGVAHDFNNLLSVILSCAGFALDAIPDGAPVREELLEIRNAGERAAALTRQLLAFSRKQLLKPESLDLNRVLGEMERLLKRIIGEDVELRQHLAPSVGLVKADLAQVEQVVMNLVINARDAMPTGGRVTIETANLELDARQAAEREGVKPGAYVMVSVSDTGLGMDQQTLRRIFEPFFTTKGPGKGTGLGLSTVYGIIKQSGGYIWAHSELGKGSTFEVVLPRAPTLGAETAPAPRVEISEGGAETILLVEDDAGVRNVAARILGASGYTVLTASGGHEALVLLGSHQGAIHLVLTDVVMPQMSGRTFAEYLGKIRPSAKVLYMSGYTDDAVVRQGVLESDTNFIGKPFTPAELVKKVREVLDQGAPHFAPLPSTAPGEDRVELPLTKDAAHALPEAIQAELKRAARAARHDELLSLLDHLAGDYPQTAWRLRQMVDAFDQDGILDVLS